MQRLLEHLSILLEYPEEHTAAALGALCLALGGDGPDQAGRPRAARVGTKRQALEALLEWGQYFCHTPLWEVQEAYTQTFDLNPTCSLDVGYYLFGEDYQRGVFMAHLRESQEAVGMEAGPELPDHLPVLLRWLARVYDTELYTEMTAECVVPVLRWMDEMLASGRGATDRQNPYRYVLQALTQLLAGDMAERGIPIAERRFRAPDLAAPMGGPGMSLEGVPDLGRALDGANPCTVQCTPARRFATLSGDGYRCGGVQ
jgi:nitrate reductase molybdenum cofactor assembly chaperone